MNFLLNIGWSILFSLLVACAPKQEPERVVVKVNLSEQGTTIETRFAAPPAYERKPAAQNSFAQYLRQLPLYPHGRKVKLFDGADKGNQRAHAAVVKMDVGQRDLQQCADAVMRLRAEHLWQQEDWSQIHFNFTSGFVADYQQWREGKRIRVNGNQVSWIPAGQSDTSYSAFRKYLIQVFSYAGTYSLSKELKKIEFADLEIGDVFIQGAFPGHAVIVVDKVEQNGSEDFAFLLAQSYMPAQDIHVLKNPNQAEAWYFSKDLKTELATPEWTFKSSDLYRF